MKTPRDTAPWRQMLDILFEFDMGNISLRRLVVDLGRFLGEVGNLREEWVERAQGSWASLEEVCRLADCAREIDYEKARLIAHQITVILCERMEKAPGTTGKQNPQGRPIDPPMARGGEPWTVQGV